MHKSLLVSKRSILLHLGVGMLFFYAFTLNIIYKILPAPTLTIPLILTLGVIFVWRQARTKIQCYHITVLMIFMLIMMSFNNANLAHGSWAGYQFAVAYTLFFIAAIEYEEWHKIAFKILLLIGIFYGVMTFYCMYNASFFKNTVIPLFDSVGYSDQMLKLYDQGYQTGFTSHYSVNAMYLSCALGVPAMYFLSGKDRQKKWGVIGVVSLIVSIFVTGKRAHAVFSIFAVLVTYYFIHSYEPMKRWFKIVFLVVSSVMLFCIFANFFPPLMNFVNRFIESAESGNMEMGRDIQRGIALTLFAEHPLFGIGWDGFKYQYVDLTGSYFNVHCVYIQLLCEVGIVGAIIYYAFFITNFTEVKRSLKYFAVNHRDSSAILPLTFSMYFQIFFLLYCLTGNPLYDAPTMFTYIVSCAISNYYHRLIRYGNI